MPSLFILRTRDLAIQLYLRNTRNLHYEEATKLQALKRQAVLQKQIQDETDRDRLVKEVKQIDAWYVIARLSALIMVYIH